MLLDLVLDGCTWADSCEIRNIERTWLRPSLCEMYDLCWSPDSQYMLACSIDQKVCIYTNCACVLV